MEDMLLHASSLFLFLTTLGSSRGNDDDPYARKRWEMVERQIISRGIRDPGVIQAMIKVPRHEFVPVDFRGSAYNDGPIPIGKGQTVSQPYIVALMSELLRPGAGKKVLEVGTGSGYQTAVLAETGCGVYTIEIIPELARKAGALFEKLGYGNIHSRVGDGCAGWEEESPFDGIIVTAAPGDVPQALVSQLGDGGRMIIPVGNENQELILIERKGGDVTTTYVTSVRFVPMTGDSGDEKA